MLRIWKATMFCAVLVFATGSLATGPAMVTFEKDGCGFGWFGCPAEVAIPTGDGGWTCPASEIGVIFLSGDQHSVRANDRNGNQFFTCQGRMSLGGLNESRFGGDVVAVERAFVCALFPDACRGRGAVILNPNTIGGLAVCTFHEGQRTTNMQEEVTPSGAVHVACFLPDPRPGQ